MARSSRTSEIAEHVAANAGAPNLGRTLDALPGSGLGSVLLDAFRRRAGRVRARDLAAVGRRALHAPSRADARLLHAFDEQAFAAASAFDAVDLSPVAPFGACATLGGLDQNNVLTALRGAEVLADPTVGLALEAMRRRHGARNAPPVRLCASARLVRMQPVDAPGFVPHFRLFALMTAGRTLGEDRFETDALREHLSAWLALVDRLRAAGFGIDGAEVEISDSEAVAALLAACGVDASQVRAVAAAHRVGQADVVLQRRAVTLPRNVSDPRRDLGPLHARLPHAAALRLDRVVERVFPVLARAHPAVPLRIDLSRLEGLGYYPGLMLRVRLRGPHGAPPVIDGGFVPWMHALCADAKERMLASAIGTEFVCTQYSEPRRPA